MVKLRLSHFTPYKSDEQTPGQIQQIVLKSGAATSGPPICPVIGQYAIPISKFCTEFKGRTLEFFKSDIEVFVTLHNVVDSSYNFTLSLPITSICFRMAVRIKKSIGVNSTMAYLQISSYYSKWFMNEQMSVSKIGIYELFLPMFNRQVFFFQCTGAVFKVAKKKRNSNKIAWFSLNISFQFLVQCGLIFYVQIGVFRQFPILVISYRVNDVSSIYIWHQMLHSRTLPICRHSCTYETRSSGSWLSQSSIAVVYLLCYVLLSISVYQVSDYLPVSAVMVQTVPEAVTEAVTEAVEETVNATLPTSGTVLQNEQCSSWFDWFIKNWIDIYFCTWLVAASVLLVIDLFGVFGNSVLMEITYHPPSQPDYTLHMKAWIDLEPGTVVNVNKVRFTEMPICTNNSDGTIHKCTEKNVAELAEVLKNKLSDAKYPKN